MLPFQLSPRQVCEKVTHRQGQHWSKTYPSVEERPLPPSIFPPLLLAAFPLPYRLTPCVPLTEGGITRDQTDADDNDGLTSGGGRRDSRTQERWMGTTERVSAGRPRWGKGERSRGKRVNGGEQALSRHFIGGRRSPVGRKSAGRRSAPRAIVCLNASMVDRLTAGLRGRWRPLSTGNSSLPAWACLSAHLLYVSSG